MKRQQILSLLICSFHIAATLQGVTKQATVEGLFSKDCILPCSFPPGNGEVIHWKKGDKNVHSYYIQSDQMKNQDLDYKSRTYLFHQNIHNGNASLKLSNLTVTDEGLYNCYVGTLETKTEWEVTLYVRVSSYYALEYQKTGSRRMLMCYAFLTYPAPQITWLLGNTSIQETNQETSRDGVLYSLRSDQNIANTTDTYHCRIHLPYANWTAEWRMEEQLSVVEGGNTTIPCDYSNTIADTEGFSVVWTRDGVILGMTAFNGTFHSSHPRAQVNQSDFSLMLHDLTTQDSGEYLCNISTPYYTKLIVRTLEVENSKGIGAIVTGAIVSAVVLLVGGGVVFCNKTRRRREHENRAAAAAESGVHLPLNLPKSKQHENVIM